MRRAEMAYSDTEDEGEVQVINPPDVKIDVAVSEEKANSEVDKIDGDDVIVPSSSVRLQPDCDVLVGAAGPASNGEKLLAGDDGLKRRRDGSGTPHDINKQVKRLNITFRKSS